MSSHHKINSTLIRERIAQILDRARRPLTIPEILKRLNRHGSFAHKTSVYRQLDKLVAERRVETVLLDPTVAYYEIVRAHHHHMICMQCRMIMCMDENGFEKKVAAMKQFMKKEKGFLILGHQISFSGMCADCQ